LKTFAEKTFYIPIEEMLFDLLNVIRGNELQGNIKRVNVKLENVIRVNVIRKNAVSGKR
jgi:hypothetical protein